MRLKSTYMLFNNSAGAVIDNNPSRIRRLFGKKPRPAKWHAPFEAFSSSTLNGMDWKAYPQAAYFHAQLVYKTDDPRNAIRINTFIGGPSHLTTLGVHTHNEELTSPVSRGLAIDLRTKPLHENLGYEVRVHPGSTMTIYRVGFNVDWILG